MLRHFVRGMIALLALSLASGCAYTHPRRSDELPLALKEPRAVLILAPVADVRLKLISAEEFFTAREESDRLAKLLLSEIEQAIESSGHRAYTEDEIRSASPSLAGALDGLAENLLGIAAEVISLDAGYNSRRCDMIDASAVIPRELRDGQIGYRELDLAIAIGIRADKETRREFWQRWVRNLTYNIVTLPLGLVSAFIPISTPLSVNISTSILEPSPDRIFATLIIVDLRSAAILYQNDYFAEELPESAGDLRALVERLFEEFH